MSPCSASRWTGPASALCAVLLSRSSWADGLEVEAPGGCAGIRPLDIQRQLALELEANSFPQGDLGGARVRLSCGERRVRIEVDDPITDKRIEREIPAPLPHEKGRERTLALAISQLFLSSWLELLVPAPPGASPPQPQRVRAEASAKKVAERAVARTRPRWFLDLTASRDHHAGSDGGWAYHAGLRLGARVGEGKVRVFVPLGYEEGRMERMGGSIGASAWRLGAGAAYDVVGGDAFRWEVLGMVELAYVRMEGLSDPGWVGRRAVGWGALPSMGTGPEGSVGPLRWALIGTAGILLPRFAADASGDAAAQWGGLVWGLGVSLGFELGT